MIALIELFVFLFILCSAIAWVKAHQGAILLAMLITVLVGAPLMLVVELFTEPHAVLQVVLFVLGLVAVLAGALTAAAAIVLPFWFLFHPKGEHTCTKHSNSR